MKPRFIAAGYRKIAKERDFFNLPFADREQIAGTVTGELALMHLTGLVKGSGGYYHPNSRITRAQAAVIVNRLLNSRLILTP